MRTPVILLALLCLASARIAAQRSHHVESDFGGGTIRIAYDRPVEPRGERIDALFRARAGWPLGGKPGALLVTTTRYSLMEGPLDTVVDSLDIHIDIGEETAETIVFGYDTAHRKTIDRYSISTERNPPNRRLTIDWGRRRWTLSITTPED
jgi:hypothetical protein